MGNENMRWIIAIIGFVLAVKGGMDLGSTMGGNTTTKASFAYAEASRDARAEWLNKVAKKLESRAKREAAGSFYVSYKETKVRPGANEIVTILKLNSGYNFRLDSKTLREGLAAACPHHVRLGLYANNIKWTQKMVKSNGQTVLNIPITRTSCSRYVATA